MKMPIMEGKHPLLHRRKMKKVQDEAKVVKKPSTEEWDEVLKERLHASLDEESIRRVAEETYAFYAKTPRRSTGSSCSLPLIRESSGQSSSSQGSVNKSLPEIRLDNFEESLPRSEVSFPKIPPSRLPPSRLQPTRLPHTLQDNLSLQR